MGVFRVGGGGGEKQIAPVEFSFVLLVVITSQQNNVAAVPEIIGEFGY